jgi:hypothetical protein
LITHHCGWQVFIFLHSSSLSLLRHRHYLVHHRSCSFWWVRNLFTSQFIATLLAHLIIKTS